MMLMMTMHGPYILFLLLLSTVCGHKMDSCSARPRSCAIKIEWSPSLGVLGSGHGVVVMVVMVVVVVGCGVVVRSSWADHTCEPVRKETDGIKNH